MNVLLIGQNNFIVGGSERYQFQVEKLLLQDGHKVYVFAAENTNNENAETSHYFPKSADFINPSFKDVFKYIYNADARVKIEKLLDDLQVDVVHLNIYYGKLTTSILEPIRRRNIPVVQTLHEYKLICPIYSLFSNGTVCEDCKGGRFYNVLLKRCNKGSFFRSILSMTESYFSRFNGALTSVDHFIAVSEFQRSKMIEHGISEEKITTIHNFIDAEKVEPSYSEGGYFLYFGRIEENKGIQTLLDAAAKLKNKVKVYFAGEGGFLSAAKQRAIDEGLTNVSFFGFMNDKELSKLINESICTITPSLWYETFGLTIIESFARGRPVIVSDIGGMTEIVEHGNDGFLFEPGNHEQLAEYMWWLVEHPVKAVEMGRMGRDKVLREFSPVAHLEKVKSVYRGLGVKC